MANDLNEFRQDLVSGDWVLFATGRAKRPGAEVEVSPDVLARPQGKAPAGTSDARRMARDNLGTGTCPFDDPVASGQEVVNTTMLNGKPWVTVVKNKYPAVQPGVCTPPTMVGPFAIAGANGFHEVVITADHQRNFQDFTTAETTAVLQSFRERYLDIAQYQCGDYIQIFNNTGAHAGASLTHPHSQILSTPILPPQITRSINGSTRYYREHGQRVHDVLIQWECEQGKRIVFENELFVAYCPFAAKRPYEVRVFPKQPSARFETSDEADLTACAETLNVCLQKLAKRFPDLQYNFFLHTAPVREDSALPSSEFYRWHFEIVPYYSILAGFDFSTGITVNVVDPDQAASELRAA